MFIGLFSFQFVVYNQKLIWDADKTNRFHVAVGLFSNRSQKTSKYGKNIGDTHLDVICDILLNGTDARQHWIYVLNFSSFFSAKGQR